MGPGEPAKHAMDPPGNQTTHVAPYPPGTAHFLPAALGPGLVYATRIPAGQHEVTGWSGAVVKLVYNFARL